MTTTADRVMRAIERVAQTDEVWRDPELLLFETGVIDSLGTVELIATIADELGVEIAPSEVDRELWATPARIVAFVESRMGN
jgi:D-alanine--poly(phosphoribitol) ligase subunit 2